MDSTREKAKKIKDTPSSDDDIQRKINKGDQSNQVHTAEIEDLANHKSNKGKQEPMDSEQIPSGSNESIGAFVEKANDGWEVVEASSDESEASGCTEYDIMVPMKLLEKNTHNQQVTTSITTAKTSTEDSKTTSDKPNVDECINIDSDSENFQKTIPSQPNLNEKQKTQSKTGNNVVKKRKFRLYTGDSDDEINIKESGIHTKTQNEKENKTQENTETGLKNQETRPTSVVPHNQNEIHSNNETFIKKHKPKFHSDSEITDDNLLTRRKIKVERMCTNETKLNYITEESEGDIIEVPRSPHVNDHHSAVQSRNQIPNTDSHRHECHCSTASLVGSPNAKRAKRNRVMKRMWHEREQKLKKKMVKKVKNMLIQVVESILSSSDESDDQSTSSDEDRHVLRKKGQKQCSNQCCTQPHQEPQNIRDLKKELEYWKNKANSKSQGLSPQELQMREMKADIDYWKQVAKSKSVAHDMPSSSHAIGRTSTPVKEYEEETFTERPMSRTNGTARVSSTADTSMQPPRHTNAIHSERRHGGSVYYMDDEELVLNPSKSNPFQCETFNAANNTRTTHAMSVLARTKFTEKEKDMIVGYLVKHYDTLELIRGNMFWMQMAHDMDTHRSWHSLKNNFFQNIIKNLEQYEMPNKVRNKIISLAKQYM